MKYWNKSKKTRHLWYKVEFDKETKFDTGTVHLELQRNPSKGKFYYDKTKFYVRILRNESQKNTWYFSLEEDAIMFRLKYV